MAVDHYENFPVASLLLPAALRRAVEVIYRFARSADDFADEGDATPRDIRLAKLDRYRAAARARSSAATRRRGCRCSATSPESFASTVCRCPLLNDLLDAFSQDVVKKRYASFVEVLDYCRRSANPVGRLLLHFSNERAEPDLRVGRRSAPRCSSSTSGRTWPSTTARQTASTCRRTSWRASA